MMLQKLFSMKLLTDLPTPTNISIFWNSGSILGMILGLQLVTGIFLSMHYTADLVTTFYSVIHIMRDVPGGWIMRVLHANGASMFFVFLYLHIGRGLYYQSFITQVHTWMIGVSIFLVCMATAFLGYVLPWGQMSFWAATVITNLMSAIPYIGSMLVEWLWGGFSVSQSTLNRFFSLHFILPFLIGGLAAIHLMFLHDKGSTDPLGSINHINKVMFHPYFTWKDLVGFLVVLLFLVINSSFFPTMLIDPENFILANSMVTPVHIQPEWYFLFAYAILRSIPSKLGGVVALAMSVFILYILPLSNLNWSLVTPFNLFYQMIFWGLLANFTLLTWLGACPIEPPFFFLAQSLSISYFGFFLLLMIEPWILNKL
uniref:Cytochrome b n=1 Tax=Ryssota otaheitana TaxID=2595071 RepID=A0A5B8G666_9EUPU|nr:cytochrome b [Ryssota otaheitana]QDM39457.1 cytochrome b [Ryssota otaheitana]